MQRSMAIIISIFLLCCQPLAARQELLYAQPSQSQQQAEAPAADFSFPYQTHDFGKITKKQSHAFEVTNTGNAPLVIKHVATGCGCTTVEYPRQPIPPGHTARIIIAFDPASQRKGAFRKSITIYTNSPRNYTRLFVKGEVLKE